MWKDSYLVGVDIIDTQHKTLFRSIEKLRVDLGRDDLPHYKQHLLETATFLKDYCIKHFSEEEEHQRKISYEGYPEHKKKHDRLVHNVLVYEKELISTDYDTSVVKGFLGFIATQLIYHIVVEDQQIPKGKTAKPVALHIKDIVHESVAGVKKVLNIIAGIPVNSINHTMGNTNHIDPEVCFKVEFVNASNEKGIGFAYTKQFALKVLKAMAGSDFSDYIADYNDISYSAVQEISDIIGSNIAGSLSLITKTVIDVKPPVAFSLTELPKTTRNFIVHTELGDMEVIMY